MYEKKIEMELCSRRICVLTTARKNLAHDICITGYPNEYPGQFKELEQAYLNLDDAMSKVIAEEAKTLLSFE